MKQIDKWYKGLSFDILEEIFKVKQSSFSPEESYQEFVDYCDNMWYDNLSTEEKKEIYKQYKDI